jgi:alkaline phosphatase D
MDIDAGGGVIIPGNDANPNTDPGIIDALRSINPWVDQADFDHHGYALVEASRNGFECTLKLIETIKRRSRSQLPTNGFRYRLERGQKSIKGVNGPDA